VSNSEQRRSGAPHIVGGMKSFNGSAQHWRRRPHRILVVDDVHDVRQIHTHFLYGTGMEVSTAENGVLALHAARDAVPDVVVTDVEMPVMDGLDLCRQLRANAATRDVVVVVVTGGPHAKAALDAGCDAVLEKPCSQTLLLTTIRRLLWRRRPPVAVGDR
jgi:CheY-like chemotaxis protein